jgi:hypothetical protein
MGVTYSSNSASTYDPIAKYVTTATTSSYTFTSIPQTYTDLILILNGLTDTNDRTFYMRVGNGSVDSGSNYTYTNMLVYSGGVVGQSSGATADNRMFISSSSTNTNNGQVVAELAEYKNTSIYKTAVSREATMGTTTTAGLIVPTWKSTAAIDTLQVLVSGGNFASGFTMSLYGRKAA